MNWCLDSITICSHIHRCGFIHRDVKPENFLVGLDSDTGMNTIYLIDFGLARRYRYRRDGQMEHIPFKFVVDSHRFYPQSCRTDKSLVGTARYASRNSHNAYELSRRDDLESMCYVLVYLVDGGELPWSDALAHHNKYHMTKRGRVVAYRKIANVKESVGGSVCSVCESLQLSPDALFARGPCEFAQILHYVLRLRFSQQPDYDYIDSLIVRAMQRIGCAPSADMLWTRQFKQDAGARLHYKCAFKWTLPRGEALEHDPA